MTTEEALIQLDWYFDKDDGIAADENTKEAYRTLASIAINSIPRFVTLEDFKNNANLDEHGRLLVWQEVRPGSQIKTWSTWMTITPEYINDLVNVRFWTLKPSKEQMEAVPWE